MEANYTQQFRYHLLDHHSADFAMKEALNKLQVFFHEAEQDVINQRAITGKNQGAN